ncbi:MAG: lipid-A-disaccharide synthase [Armatimonadota bacterium]
MRSPEPRRRVFLIAGEVSGDLHGADLAREITALDPRVRLEGIGGRRMAAAGVELVEDSGTWSVMGWVDAARQIRSFMRRLDAAASRLLADPPRVLVPIDFSGFNLALLKRLRGRIAAVYYVPPMVSIRRGRRAARVAGLGARLLPIFPFEAEAYRRAGANVMFVGHPAVELAEDLESADLVRARLGIARSSPVLGLLPGSRQSELDRLLGLMLETARLVRTEIPALTIVLALASSMFREQVELAVASSGLPIAVVDGAREVMRISTVLLTASGTATVEAMVRGVPMVVTYRTSWINWWILPLAVNARHAAIPNIMAGGDVVPELLQRQATPHQLRAALTALLRDPGARDAMRARLLELAAALGPPGAARRAAREVIAAMGSPALKADLALT